jgi:hypothetical protein|tara:strand:+ start:2627 stop:2842 length:216 start_codon:yes stop_codon:yes gene_type:complete
MDPTWAAAIAVIGVQLVTAGFLWGSLSQKVAANEKLMLRLEKRIDTHSLRLDTHLMQNIEVVHGKAKAPAA